MHVKKTLKKIRAYVTPHAPIYMMILGDPGTLEEMWRRFYDIASLTHPDSGGVGTEFDALIDSLPTELARFPDTPTQPIFAQKRPSLRDIFDVAFDRPSCTDPIDDLEGPAGMEQAAANGLECAETETFELDVTKNYSEF